jgi:hypothetical protein
MAGKPRYRRAAALKVIERLLTHPHFAEGLPVRFRCDPSLTKPDRFGRHRRRHTASTLRPHSIHNCAPKRPFASTFPPPECSKRKESKGFFVPTPKNLRQGVGRAYHTGSVGNK